MSRKMSPAVAIVADRFARENAQRFGGVVAARAAFEAAWSKDWSQTEFAPKAPPKPREPKAITPREADRLLKKYTGKTRADYEREAEADQALLKYCGKTLDDYRCEAAATSAPPANAADDLDPAKPPAKETYLEKVRRIQKIRKGVDREIHKQIDADSDTNPEMTRRMGLADTRLGASHEGNVLRLGMVSGRSDAPPTALAENPALDAAMGLVATSSEVQHDGAVMRLGVTRGQSERG